MNALDHFWTLAPAVIAGLFSLAAARWRPGSPPDNQARQLAASLAHCHAELAALTLTLHLTEQALARCRAHSTKGA